MSGSVNPLHALIDRVDARTWHARQRLAPGDRRVIMEMICASREAALHYDEHAVLHLCQQVERRVRDLRFWRIAAWLSEGNDKYHPRIASWFLTCKRLELERRGDV